MALYYTFLETERGEKIGTWDCLRSVEKVGFLVGGRRYDEQVTIWDQSPDDRLRAAIVNLGLACRYYIDNEIFRGIVELKTDADGKDFRYANEHGILYSLINPSDVYESRKHNALYADYLQYLKRIREYVKMNEIRIDIGEGYD